MKDLIEEGIKVSVQHKRASVLIISYGESPFTLEPTKQGFAWIPNGFVVECKCDGETWIGRTLVENQGGEAKYSFHLKRDPTIKSSFQPNPTAAYKEVSILAGNERLNKGSNGRLIIGVTYDNLQALIREYHNLGDPDTNEIQVRKAKRVRSLPSMRKNESEENPVPKRVYSMQNLRSNSEQSVESREEIKPMCREFILDEPLPQDELLDLKLFELKFEEFEIC